MGCLACRACRAVAAVAIIAAGTVATLAHLGVLPLPLPGPAHGKFANPLPDGVELMPTPRPLEGDFAPNTRLRSAVRLFDGQIKGAESVAVGPSGQLVMLDRHNHLYEAREQPGGGGWRLGSAPRAKLGAGRPLGYEFDAGGDLIVCDSLKGLVRYGYATGAVELLATHVSASSPLDTGSEITYANDLAVAAGPGGAVYFTSCTDVVPPLNPAGFYDTYRAWFLGLMQGLPRGRLLRYDPKTKETHVLAKGFYYANGVALSEDETYVALAETDRLRVHKVWVKGPKAGQSEVLIDRLPGAPDGVAPAAGGAFWVSLVAPAPPFVSALLSSPAALRSPLVRALHAWLPPRLRPGLRRWGGVARVDGATGRVLEFLCDPDGRAVSTVSAVSEHGGRLFLGNLVGSYVSYLDLERGGGGGSGGGGGGEATPTAAGRAGGRGGEL